MFRTLNFQNWEMEKVQNWGMDNVQNWGMDSTQYWNKHLCNVSNNLKQLPILDTRLIPYKCAFIVLGL